MAESCPSSWGVNQYYPVRIPIRKPCKGYYIRWWYNGWHYWFFLPGENYLDSKGEEYYTLGTRRIEIGSGQVTYSEAQAIRTILLSREVYILALAGWKNIRIEPGKMVTYRNQINGYEVGLFAIIGSKELSVETGFTPTPIIPVVAPDIVGCEIIIGSQIWACYNVASRYPGSKVYNNNEDYRAIYGGLYTWAQVMEPGFAPPGWHVPTSLEWVTHLTYTGGAGELKEIGFDHWLPPNTGAVDTYGFAALGGGYCLSDGVTFAELLMTGKFWTATEGSRPALAYHINMNYDSANFQLTERSKFNYLSVRLIKDTPPTFNDWFLPSQGEIADMYTHLHLSGLGNFSAGIYWTSYEINATTARRLSFINGLFGNSAKNSTYYVRACRTFVAAAGAYILRGIGPAGGRIFHITGGTTYFESAPSDQSVNYKWSNIINGLIGTTSPDIGEGQNNTNEIIAQAGHLDSAAKLCDDLII